MTIQQLSGREMVKCIDFMYRFCKRHPGWMPSLRLDIRAQHDPRRNPFFKHDGGPHCLAALNRRPLGRAVNESPLNG